MRISHRGTCYTSVTPAQCHWKCSGNVVVFNGLLVCIPCRLAASCHRFKIVNRKCLKALSSTTAPWMETMEAAWPTWLTWVKASVTERMEDFQPWWEQYRSGSLIEVCFYFPVCCVTFIKVIGFGFIVLGRPGARLLCPIVVTFFICEVPYSQLWCGFLLNSSCMPSQVFRQTSFICLLKFYMTFY